MLFTFAFMSSSDLPKQKRASDRQGRGEKWRDERSRPSLPGVRGLLGRGFHSGVHGLTRRTIDLGGARQTQFVDCLGAVLQCLVVRGLCVKGDVEATIDAIEPVQDHLNLASAHGRRLRIHSRYTLPTWEVNLVVAIKRLA